MGIKIKLGLLRTSDYSGTNPVYGFPSSNVLLLEVCWFHFSLAWIEINWRGLEFYLQTSDPKFWDRRKLWSDWWEGTRNRRKRIVTFSFLTSTTSPSVVLWQNLWQDSAGGRHRWPVTTTGCDAFSDPFFSFDNRLELYTIVWDWKLFKMSQYIYCYQWKWTSNTLLSQEVWK